MDYYFTISKLLTPLVSLSNFLILGLTICFYFGIINKKKLFKKIFIILFLSFTTLSIFPIGYQLFYLFLEKEYYDQSIPENIDYIFVPSGGQERFITAIDIKNKYKLKNVKILYSSGNPFLDKENSEDKEKFIIDKIIKNSKIKNSDIIFLPEARNTFENIKRLNEYLNKINNHDSKILLVTHAFHLKRCLLISKKYKLNIFGYASSYYTKKHSSGFLNNYQGVCLLCNLNFMDYFVKESLSLIFAKFYKINEH